MWVMGSTFNGAIHNHWGVWYSGDNGCAVYGSDFEYNFAHEAFSNLVGVCNFGGNSEGRLGHSEVMFLEWFKFSFVIGHSVDVGKLFEHGNYTLYVWQGHKGTYGEVEDLCNSRGDMGGFVNVLCDDGYVLKAPDMDKNHRLFCYGTGLWGIGIK